MPNGPMVLLPVEVIVLFDGPIAKLSMSTVLAKSIVAALGVMLATLLPRSVLKPACAFIAADAVLPLGMYVMLACVPGVLLLLPKLAE